MDRDAQQSQSSRVLSLRKSFSLALHSLLLACPKEDFLRIFSSFKHANQETLYQLYLQMIASIHGNIQDEFESVCKETQVMTALGTIEQLIENQKLDVLHEEKGTEAYKTSVNDVKQELARRKLSEIHYLKSMLEKLQEQNQIDKKRIELLRSERDDASSHADSALRKLRDYNAPLKEICRSMNAHFGS